MNSRSIELRELLWNTNEETGNAFLSEVIESRSVNMFKNRLDKRQLLDFSNESRFYIADTKSSHIFYLYHHQVSIKADFFSQVTSR